MAAVHTKGRGYISHRTQERDQDRWDFSTLVNTQVGQIPLIGALLSSLVTSDRISSIGTFILGHFERLTSAANTPKYSQSSQSRIVRMKSPRSKD
jgi:hypothetical protein